MQFTATPTKPADLPLRAMLDLPELPGEYAVLLSFDGSTSSDDVFLTVMHAGHLYSIATTTETDVSVVSYALSNVLETSPPKGA